MNNISFVLCQGITSEKCHTVTLTEFDDCLKPNLLDSAKAIGSWIIIRNLQHAKRWFGEIEKVHTRAVD